MANTLALGCVVALAIWATTAAYRIWLHPLSRYPGSKTAAVSNSWWELYWNYYRNGEMIFEIERLHKVHGPVIRIGVNDIHISDPRVFYDITQVKSTFTKSADFYQHISFPKTLIGESDVAWHRTRRRVLAPALTGSRLQGLAEDVMLKSRHLMARFEEAAAKSSPVCINAAMKAFTMDIISPIVLGQDFECVLDDQFHNQFSEHLRAAFSVGWISTAFPLTSAFALKVASYTSVSIFPLPLLTFKRKCLGITKKYIENAANQANDGQTNSKKSPVIDLLMDAGGVDGHVVPALSELNDELIMLLIAGNDTTSHSLIFGIYQISTNPTVQRRLVEELVREFPTLEEDVTYVRAKKLEFLTATIKEIVRLGSPLPGRLPRTVPPEGYCLYGHELKAGINIHSSAYILNRHADIWDRPNEFIPDRWITGDVSKLDKYMASFNKGARQCLGKDLAICELYVVLASLFRRFRILPHMTSEEDMAWKDLVLVSYKNNFNAHIEKRTH